MSALGTSRRCRLQCYEWLLTHDSADHQSAELNWENSRPGQKRKRARRGSDESADSNAMYGGQVAEVVAKACFEPSTLINAELFILDRYVAGV